MKFLSFKIKMVLLLTLPVLIIGVILTAIAVMTIRQLTVNDSYGFAARMYEQRRAELKNYTQMALTSIQHLYRDDSLSDQEAQESAKTILRNLRYGRDGYFFVYDFAGKNVAHPVKPHLEGQNLWDLQDEDGVYVIRSLVESAKLQEGGYTNYLWDKPSLGRTIDKLGFSQGLERWQWMIGTGLYMDDVEANVALIGKQANDISRSVIFLSGALLILAGIVMTLFAIRFTANQERFASEKLRQLSYFYLEERERERTNVASELHTNATKAMSVISRNLRQLSKVPGSRLPLLTNNILKMSSALSKTATSVLVIADKLQPTVLINEGVYQAIKALADSLMYGSGIRISVSMLNVVKRPKPVVEAILYRTVQEALTNVVLHSKATEASVRIRESDHLLSITVQDNGMGFDIHKQARASEKRKKHHGVGLVGMELQTELLGGDFSFFSSEGTGTLIKIVVPLKD